MLETTDKPSPITNPNRGEDVLLKLSFTSNFKGLEQKLHVALIYIPEREIITEENFSSWIKVLQAEEWATPEHLIGYITVAFYDRLLPHHIEIIGEIAHKSGINQHIHQIRQQPDYKLSQQLQRVIEKS